MGGAFVAVSDDTSAVGWNPAGLGQLKRMEAAFNYSAIFNGKIYYLFSSFAWPMFEESIMGFSWERRTFTDAPDKLNEDVYYATFASSMTEDRTFFWGANFKFFNAGSQFTNVGGKGMGLDWGMLYRLPLPKWGKEMRVGFAWQDMSTELKEQNGVIQSIPGAIRMGFAYQFERWVMIAADWEQYQDVLGKLSAAASSTDQRVSSFSDNRLRAGVEGWFFDGTLGVRIGYVGFASMPGRYAGGLSYRANDWEVDYAYLGHAGNLGDSHRASFALRFGRESVGGVKPSTPVGLKVSAKDSEVELLWNPSPEPTVGAYNIYVSTAPGGEYRKVNTVSVPSARVIGLENGRTYYFVVTSITNSQPPMESDKSAEIPATPVAPQVSAPELTAQVQEGEVQVSWRATQGDIAGYNLYISTYAGGGSVKYNQQPLASTSVRMVQLPGGALIVAGERYYIVIRSVTRYQPPVEGPPSGEQVFIAVPRQ